VPVPDSPTGTCASTLVDGIQQPGRHALTWNRTDSRGRPLPAGVYFLTLDNRAKRISRKVVLTE